MAARKFKFVSPGVFLKEIDNSQLPKLPGNVGPVIIGRTRRGPALNPVKVDSYADFIEKFGEPIPGNQGDDPWREGTGLLATAYAGYAAKAYFAADIESPVTMVRLLGVSGDNATDAGASGWTAGSTFGLVTYPSGAVDTAEHNLSAIFYLTSSDGDVHVRLLGEQPRDPEDAFTIEYVSSGSQGTCGAPLGHVIKTDAQGRFTIMISASAVAPAEHKIDFTRGSKNYIRDVLNTNPVMTNTSISYVPSGTLAQHYWLGETFDELVPSSTIKYGYIVRLQDTSAHGPADFDDFSHDANAGKSGWVISQHEGINTNYVAADQAKLFRIIALAEGEEASRNTIVAIEDIRAATDGATDPYGTFTVCVKRVFGTKLEVVESFPGCNLNPNSQNYVARQIGDQYFQWSATEKRNKVYGSYVNNSDHIRVDMDPNVDQGSVAASKIPFGFLGPIIPKQVTPTAFATGSANFQETGSFINHLSTTFSSSVDADQVSFKVNWPALPTVHSASTDGLDYFGAAVYKKTSAGALTGELDRGMIDYIRRMPKGLAATQDKGTIVGNETNSQYAFIFSLDDVVLKGTNLTDTSTANVTASYFEAGTRKGVGSSAQIVATANPAADQTITITTTDGTAVIFKAHNTTTQGAGATPVFKRDAANFGLSTLKIAIEESAIKDKVTVSSIVTRGGATSAEMTITQVVGGKTGNKTITSNLGGYNIGGVGLATNGVFKGGQASYLTDNTDQIATLLELGFDKFHMPLVGGFDGVDITEADPFNNSTRTLDGKTTANSYAYASVDRAIELIRDPEVLEHNLAVMPGITNASLTKKLVEKCESRADSLAIIDLPLVYKPPHEAKCKVFADRIGTNPDKAAKALKARQINSSYAASYYPWVKIRDDENTRDVWVPPSVVALGVMAYTEQRDEVWFAPAGFNRGGLNEGNAGVPVLQVSEQLMSKQRDTLYEANINPIASFVTEGLVIFGQKTLQSTPSALDRINVRRLLIFVKKEISRIASGLLFDQNVPATWNRFTGQVNPFLESVKTRLGLSDFKVILDNSTTTPDLVDRNVMYAKIFLKPARAIEFIAVDFVITNTGASFDD